MGWGRILFFYECNIISLVDFKWTIVRLIVTTNLPSKVMPPTHTPVFMCVFDTIRTFIL